MTDFQSNNNGSAQSGDHILSKRASDRPRSPRVRQRTGARRRDEHQPKQISSSDIEFRWDSGRTLGTSRHGRGKKRGETFDYSASYSGLGYARDAGMAVRSRREMREIVERKRRRTWTIAGIVVLVVALICGIGWMNSSNKDAIKLKLPASSAVVSTTNTEAASAQTAAALEATPILGSYKNMEVHLPVAIKDLTEVAFHQANYSYTVKVKTHMPSTKLETMRKTKSSNRDISLQQNGPRALLVGSHIEMWRSGRHTAMGTAVDVGAKAGTTTISPIDGVVTKVKLYNFENKVNDYEIHIACTEYPGIEMVMIHVEKPQVQVGQTVVAGVTKIATVRNMSKYVRNQLASYAPQKGNHVHIQFNDTTCSAYAKRQKELEKEGLLP